MILVIKLIVLLSCSSLFPWPPHPATLCSPSMVSVSQSTALSTCPDQCLDRRLHALIPSPKLFSAELRCLDAYLVRHVEQFSGGEAVGGDDLRVGASVHRPRLVPACRDSANIILLSLKNY